MYLKYEEVVDKEGGEEQRTPVENNTQEAEHTHVLITCIEIYTCSI